VPTSNDGAAGLTETDATGTGAGAETVTVDVPVLPSLVAVIVAVPAAIPVTTPPLDTVATELALVVQLTVLPVRTLLLASRMVADSVTVAPV